MSNEEQELESVGESELEADQALSLSDLSQRVIKLEERLEQVIVLLSDVYRYGKLRDLLREGNLREADQETTKVMLEIAGHRSQETVTPDDALQFPCSAIQLIDQLWVKHSNGRFGFSVQQRIYSNLGGTSDISQIDLDVLHATGDRIGRRVNGKWLDYDQLDFSFSAPEGTFPAGWWDSPYGAKMVVYFLARLMQCNV